MNTEEHRIKIKMPASYSYDLRTKLINAIDEGMTKTQASCLFQISRNTINLWLKRREEKHPYFKVIYIPFKVGSLVYQINL